jgi:hypothetical protein
MGGTEDATGSVKQTPRNLSNLHCRLSPTCMPASAIRNNRKQALRISPNQNETRILLFFAATNGL